MNDIYFLSMEEVKTLTGSGTKAGQIMILKRNGIRHTIKRSGWPCVIASALTGEPVSPIQKPTWQPRKAV